jgi:hypothetical protein
MKITILGTAKFEEGTAKFVEGEGVCIGIEFVIGKGVDAKKHMYLDGTGLDMNEWNKQKSEPLHIKSYVYQKILYKNGSVWVFRDYLYLLEGAEYESEDVKKLHVKHFAFRKEKQFLKLMKEVERFERFEKISPVYREQIPEEVRMYVWRRDNGRCVNCNSDKDIEFDHIIPASEGGSNTERNIQLLCAKCNKEKSNKI